uniref:Uncharacterized protein n=1 Tax=Micrurus spixii TaxID=129469 RepID=A0A2D4MCJ4_9SAUR
MSQNGIQYKIILNSTFKNNICSAVIQLKNLTFLQTILFMFGTEKIDYHRFTVLSLILPLSFLKPITNVALKSLHILCCTLIYIKEHVCSIPLLKRTNHEEKNLSHISKTISKFLTWSVSMHMNYSQPTVTFLILILISNLNTCGGGIKQM